MLNARSDSPADAIPAARSGGRWPIFLVFPLAGLLVMMSLGGLLLPAIYARETPGWALEAIAQDWVDLVLVAPLLLASAGLAARGSARAEAVLTGVLMFMTYSLVIYGFSVHFNALFLVYVTALGVAAYALIGLIAAALRPDHPAPAAAAPAALLTGVGWFFVIIAILFALLWLSDIVPALLRGEASRKTVAAGLPTNPVHVIDLALFLPAQILVGVALLRREHLGLALAPVFLASGAVMSATMATSRYLLVAAGLPGKSGLAVGFVVFALINLALLVLILRPARAARPPA